MLAGRMVENSEIDAALPGSTDERVRAFEDAGAIAPGTGEKQGRQVGRIRIERCDGRPAPDAFTDRRPQLFAEGREVPYHAETLGAAQLDATEHHPQR